MTPAEMAALHLAAFTQSRPWSEGEFRDLLTLPGTFATGDTRAFALVRVVLDEAELLTIATHPDHRRQGLARDVMVRWQDQAVSLGATRAFLEVATDNPGAISLYEACGYAPAGRRKGYYARAHGPAADALIMSREIAA